MKNIVPVFVLGLISVPLFFNSCQGGFKSQASLNSKLSTSSCKVTLENGQYLKISHSYNNVPNEFAEGKVKLNPKGDGLMMASKGEEIVKAGANLSAIFNNICLKDLIGTPKTTGVRSLLVDGQDVPFQDLIHQAYDITLTRDYSVSELNGLADEDSCLVGMSWDETYGLESMETAAAAAFNDTETFKQEHLTSIEALSAYTQFYGATGPSATVGKTVKVAVVDSGVDWQHPDLQQNFWTHTQGWGIDATTIHSGTVNYNPFDVSSVGHGTHIAGLVAAVSNNSRGIIGTMPFNARIMAVKIFKLNTSGDLETSTTHFYNGLQFAVLNGAEVINLSLMATGSGYDAVARAGIDDALARGITVVGAMGNGSPNGQLVDGTTLAVIPAIYATKPGVMAVGSFDSSSMARSSFSHYSTTFAEISAPGAESSSSGIFSTLPLALGSYGRLKGTSQSTGIVSGAAALVISAIKAAYSTPPSPAEVERLILESATKNSALAGHFKDGNQLNLKNLVAKMHLDYPKTKDLGGVIDPSDPIDPSCD